MYKFKHRISAFLLSAFVVFGTVSSQYLTVQAFDWVAPSVYMPFTGALPYLMGLLGVAPSNSSSINWDAWRDEYEEYALNGDLNITKNDLDNWISDISNGQLNQVSDCWTAFKDWVINKFGVVSTGSVSDCIYNVTGINYNVSNSNFVFTQACFSHSSGSSNYAFRFMSDCSAYINGSYCRADSNGSYLNVFVDGSSVYLEEVKTVTKGNNIFYIGNSNFYWYNVEFPVNDKFFNWDIDSLTTSNFIYNKDLIDNLSFALNNAISSAIPDVIPLPWDQIGDTVDEITDTIDGLIEQVNTGVLSISAYMQAVLDLIGAIAVDTTTDLVYPQNPDKPDETIDDKTDANKENQGFTLLGLEKVFPFCIPFDIYAFMTLLVAEPVAPVINWPVYNPITQENEIITIDFSTWESVVVLFRYIFDFLFIIGLLLMARALIGGGDSA